MGVQSKLARAARGRAITLVQERRLQLLETMASLALLWLSTLDRKKAEPANVTYHDAR